jgi:hypothetical protein
MRSAISHGVIEVLSGEAILPAQEGPAHAAGDAVVPGGVVEGDEGSAGAGHGGTPGLRIGRSLTGVVESSKVGVLLYSLIDKQHCRPRATCVYGGSSSV